MNFIRFNSIIAQSTRFLIVAFACTTIFFANSLPAFALGSTPSNPTQGSVNLNKIQERTNKSTYDPPTTIKEIQQRSQGGINEIQGTADADKMKNSGNSQQANTAIDDIEDLLKKADKK